MDPVGAIGASALARTPGRGQVNSMSQVYPLPYPRAALVTGAAKRIGREIALELARQDWAVVAHYNASGPEAHELVGRIEQEGGRAVALQADLAAERQLGELIPRAQDAVGALGLLINNAARFEPDDALDASRESWDRHMETNLRAPFVLMQDFARQLPDDAHGVIANILDQRVWNLTPHFTSYTMSKAGLWTLTRTMAMALAPRIRVVAIGPGPTIRSARQSEAQFARQAAATPLGRGATAAEISTAIEFVLAAPSLTGQMIALDGGEHMGWAQAPERAAQPLG